MSTYSLSVIVPAYNAEKYIEKCLTSLLQQNGISLEIIVVNDGSTDSTEKLVETAAKTNDNIVLINQKNQGLYRSRINGVQYAHAEYITFCDSDDYIDPNFYPKMLEIIRNENADVLQFGYRKLIDSKTINENIVPNYSCTGVKAIKIMLETHMFSNNNVNKIYKTCLFNGESFSEDVRFYDEDKLINVKILRKASHVKSVPDVGYNYVIKGTGIVGTVNKRKGIDVLKTDTYIYEYVKRYIPELAKSAAYDFCARLAECYWRCGSSKELLEQKQDILIYFKKLCKENCIIFYKPKKASIARVISINLLYLCPPLYIVLRKWRNWP